MTGLANLGNETRKVELAGFIMREVQRILSQYIEAVKQNEKAAVGHLLTPADDLNALTSEFLHSLAAEAARRLNANASEAAWLTLRAEDPLGCPILKTEDIQREGAHIEEWAGPVVGQTHLEKHFGIPRSTLHWWQRHNDVIALRKGARNHVFPLAQFIDGRPTPGIRQVLSSISNPRLAWLWLVRPSPLLNSRVPIEMLRKDLTAEVASAARAFFWYHQADGSLQSHQFTHDDKSSIIESTSHPAL